MSDIELGKIMYDKAVAFLDKRFPTEWGKILTACGICRERLRYWGNDVKIAISNSENKIIFKTIKELDPFYWGDCFDNREDEEYIAGICVKREEL